MIIPFKTPRKTDITYYINLPKIAIYKRCICRWIKQKIRKETYNYKLRYTNQDFKNKMEKCNVLLIIQKNTKFETKMDIKKFNQ